MMAKKEVKKEIDWRIVITAIIALVIMECYAIYNGMNGTLFSIVVAIVAGLAGWIIPGPKLK